MRDGGAQTNERGSAHHLKRGAVATAAAIGLALTALIAVTPTPAAAAVDEYAPLQRIGFGNRASGHFAVSDNAEFLTVSNVNGRYFHISVDTGKITTLASTSASPSEDGLFVSQGGFDPEINAFRAVGREQVGSRTVEPVPSPTRIDLGYDESWPVSHVTSTTDDGRYQLLSSYRGAGENIRRYVVWDTLTQSAATPINGLPGAPGDTFITSIRFDDSGTAVLYRTLCCIGGTHHSYERLNFLTGERTTIAMEYPTLGVDWHASANREWRVFYAAASDLAGFDGQPRLYRQNLTTGVYDQVPVENGTIEELSSLWVSDAGTVLYTGKDADGQKQLEAWSGDGDQSELVSMGVDGQPADWGIETARYVDGGDTIVMTSRSSNLDPAPNGTGGVRFYITSLLDEEEPPPTTTATTLAPTTTAVSTTASPTTIPGSGIEITPRATGFDVAHSIDGAVRHQVRHRPENRRKWTWTSPTSASSQSLSRLDSGRTYEVQVRGLIGGKWQSWVSALVTTTEPGETTTTTVPPTTRVTTTAPTTTAPGGATASVDATSTRPSIDVQAGSGELRAEWFHPRAVRYQYRYSLSNGSDRVWSPVLTAESDVIDDLLAGAEYRFEVRALFGGSWKDWARVEVTA